MSRKVPKEEKLKKPSLAWKINSYPQLEKKEFKKTKRREELKIKAYTFGLFVGK